MILILDLWEEASPIPMIISNLKPNAKQAQRLPNLFYSFPGAMWLGLWAWPDLAGLQLAIATATEAWGWGNATATQAGETVRRVPCKVRCDRLPTPKSS
jgi:hypothetical protein